MMEPGKRQVKVALQAVGEEEDLRVEAPTAHIGVEVRQVGVLGHRFKEGVILEAGAQHAHQRRFANTDVAGYCDIFLHPALPAARAIGLPAAVCVYQP